VLSQVVLSFVLPFAIIPLLHFTNKRDLMGALVNRPVTRVLGWAAAAVIISLNVVLLYVTFGGSI
jgi:manganese transport protein